MKTVAFVLASSMAASASAQDWLDDFTDGSATDGSPVTWVPSPAFNAAFSVVDGDMLITVDTGRISSPRVDSYFAAGASVRARMVAVDGPGRFTVAFADAPTGIKGYVASLSTCGGGRIELFRGDTLGFITHLGSSPDPWPYGPEDEFIVQLDVFAGEVACRVWKPGDPFPAAAISAPDTTYADGVPSIAIQDFGSGGNGCGGFGDYTDAHAIVRYTQVSSTPLTHSACGDFGADGLTDSRDILSFLNAWAASDLSADFNDDGALDSSDVLDFLNAWTTGC